MPTPPKQARSIATEQKMLDAAEELLRAGDARSVTLENVVKLSGTSVGSFYARFGSVVFVEPSNFIGRKTSIKEIVDSTTQMAYAYLTTE
jgi:AcrR family transcriptional regulator